MEEFKIIEGYEGYSVSNLGNVKNNITGRFLVLIPNVNGYYRVHLRKDGKRKTIVIHKLIAKAFIPNPENKPYIDHINNNKSDNTIENLRWCTRQENGRNRVLNSNSTSGIKGVSYDKNFNKWKAYVQANGKRQHLGLFNTLEEAKIARQKKANELFGEFTNAIERIKTDLEILEEEFKKRFG